MYSQFGAGSQWEIWLTLPDGSRQQVDELGTFGTFGEAVRAACLLTRLLHDGDRSPEVLMWVHHGRDRKDAKALLRLETEFYRAGVDPRRVAAEVEEYGSVSACPATDPRPTDVVPVSATRRDAGHGARGPRGRRW